MFHILTAFITTFATISYYGMAIHDGVSYNKITSVEKTDKHFPDITKVTYREVYWARYVDWSVTTPLLLLDLALLAGLSGANILVAIVADLIMILTGLFAALTVEEAPKWGWYTMACIAYLIVVYQLAVNGRGVVQNKDKKTATFFSAIAGFTLVLWTIYPMYVCHRTFSCKKTDTTQVSGALPMEPALLMSMPRLSHTLSSMFLPSPSLASGFSSLTTLCPGKFTNLVFHMATTDCSKHRIHRGFLGRRYGQ